MPSRDCDKTGAHDQEQQCRGSDVVAEVPVRGSSTVVSRTETGLVVDTGAPVVFGVGLPTVVGTGVRTAAVTVVVVSTAVVVASSTTGTRGSVRPE